MIVTVITDQMICKMVLQLLMMMMITAQGMIKGIVTTSQMICKMVVLLQMMMLLLLMMITVQGMMVITGQMICKMLLLLMMITRRQEI
jgi:hypothetical protein